MATLPNIVERGIDELRVYGKLSGWYRASKDERDSVDAYLVAIEHPSAYEAGTPEYRYTSLVKELSAA